MRAFFFLAGFPAAYGNFFKIFVKTCTFGQLYMFMETNTI